MDQNVVHPLDLDPLLSRLDPRFPFLGLFLHDRLGLLGRKQFQHCLTRGDLAVADGRVQLLFAPDPAVLQDLGKGLELQEGGTAFPQLSHLPVQELFPQRDGSDALLVFDPDLDTTARPRGLDDLEPVPTRVLRGCGQDLDDIAIAEFIPERDNSAVDPGARTTESDIGMNAEGKVDWGGPPRQRLHIPFRGKDIDLLREEIDADRIEKLPTIFQVPPPVEQLAQPEKVLFRLIQGGLPLLVGPVHGNALLRRPVHLLGPDLDLGRLPLRADYGGMEGLVHVGFGDSNEVLESARDRLPEAVDHP